MKTKRNLSGVYIRSLYNDKWDNVCFEDMTDQQRDEWMKGKSATVLKQLVLILADTLNEIGDQFDIIKE